MALSVGADPECFVQEDDKIISVIGLLGGSKEEPRPVEGGAVQEDNMLAEFNIEPAKSAASFVKNINTVVSSLEGVLEGKQVVFKPSHHFDKKDIIAGGNKAIMFGCDPDFNCWSLQENRKPNSYTTLRTAGGHVHFGYSNPTESQSIELMRLTEYLLGLPSVILDNDSERRNLYGKSGAFRFKPYGAEYRVLSNFWLQSDVLKTWVFNQAEIAYELLKTNRIIEFMEVLNPKLLSQIIDTSDVEQAVFFCKHLGITLPRCISDEG